MNLIELIKYVELNENSALFYTPKIYKSSKTYLFKNVEGQVKIYSQKDIKEGFVKIDNLIYGGKKAFGLIDYEFGYLLEDRLNKYHKENKKPLLQFYFSSPENVENIPTSDLNHSYLGKHIGKDLIRNFRLNANKDEYVKNIQQIKEYIKKGDTYQVNYTIRSKFSLIGTLTELLAQLIFTQSAKYIAFINLPKKFIVSASPELFFEILDNRITVNPMKGTKKRGINLLDDEQQKSELEKSEKDKAENIMIVDLLRNDIGKFCHFDSVKVTKQYEVEKYESVYQLTTETEGELKEKSISQILSKLFPSGSITGAPKIRTMEIINKLEKEPRGIYTGLIGLFDKNRSAANVAIRTIEVDKNNFSADLGIGSGIVWDSDPENEYDEVILKSKYLTEPINYFEIFESMLVERGKIFLLDLHLERLRKSAEYFIFNFNSKEIEKSLDNVLSNLNETKNYKLRLAISKWGEISIRTDEIEGRKDNLSIVISKDKIDSRNKFQYFKTTNRKLYDDQLRYYRTKGFGEVIYFNENDKLVEGSFTNIIIEINGIRYTPAIENGVLNGCYRRYLLNMNKDLIEKEISRKELFNSEKIILINSVRKEMKVHRLFDESENLVKTLD